MKKVRPSPDNYLDSHAERSYREENCGVCYKTDVYNFHIYNCVHLKTKLEGLFCKREDE